MRISHVVKSSGEDGIEIESRGFDCVSDGSESLGYQSKIEEE